MQNKQRSSGTLHTGIRVILATTLTKVIDVGKNILAVSRFGVTAQADVYSLIIGLPDFLVVVVGLDTVRGVATTFFTEDVVNGDRERSRLLLSSLMSWGLILSFVLATISFLGMPYVIRLMAGGFASEKFSLAVSLGYIVIPAIILRGIVGVLQAALNAHGLFAGLTLLSSIMAVSVVSTLLVSGDDHLTRNVAIAYTTAYCIYVVILAILARTRVRWTFRLGTLPPAFWEVIRYSGVLVISMMSAQGAVFVEKRAASFFPDGTMAALGYANGLASQVVFLGVLSLFPVMQRRLTHRVVEGDLKKVVGDYWHMLSYLLFALAFCAAALAVLRFPILSVMYERRAFDTIALERTAAPLAIYSIWIIGQVVALATTTLLLALKQARAIVIGSILAYGIEMSLVGSLSNTFGASGIALASCIGISMYAIFLVIGVRLVIGEGTFRASSTVVKVMCAAIGATGVMIGTLTLLTQACVISPLIVLGSVTTAGALTHIAIARLLGVNYFFSVWSLLRRHPS